MKDFSSYPLLLLLLICLLPCMPIHLLFILAYLFFDTSFSPFLSPSLQIEEFDLPVARNQAHIIKNFCQLSRQGFCQIVLGEDKDMAAQRMALLEQVTKREIGEMARI